MNIKLVNVSEDNFDEVVELQLEPEQEDYLPSNAYSIAESTLSPLFNPRVICRDKQVVGFLMYQFGEYGLADKDECILWRFMIDRRFQNQRIGHAAMALLLPEIRLNTSCSRFIVYYDQDNPPARQLYTSFGFRPIGFRDDGDVIAELSLQR